MTSSTAGAERTIMDHLLDRLSALGVQHVFGVPGDYNLAVLDRVVAHPDITWVGTSGELGAAYAADAYGRTKGFGALLTTFGVGELSAINGVAGAYAEHVPLLHIAIGPTRETEQAGSPVHHTMLDGDFDRFARAHRQVVCADAVLSPDNAVTEIDRVLIACLRESRPGYLRVPRDTALAPVPPHGPLVVPDPRQGDAFQVQAFRAAARARLAAADSVAVLADFLVDRFRARDELAGLLRASSFPHAVLASGKTVVDESSATFLGLYAGASSRASVRAVIDGADLLIRAGVRLTDLTTGKFTHGFDPAEGIDLGPTTVTVDGRAFPDVPLAVALTVLTELAGELIGEGPAAQPPTTGHERRSEPAWGKRPIGRTAATAVARARACCRGVSPMVRPLTQRYLWQAVAAAVRPGDTVVSDDGTALFGIVDHPFPRDARFIGQPIWASIGFGLPALLGAELGGPSRRGILLVGDGAAQLTVQELGTIGRHGLKPIIILVDNSGYTIERTTHGRRAVYNDISDWRWGRVPTALGARNPLVLGARTPWALDRALSRAVAATDRLVLIQAYTGKDDVPPMLKRLAANRPDRARWVP
ncbi:alpha-keto acid decarboxylase family protein [Streptomyces sp. NPDC057798]|uniref:alpha-keto acid decarboxylase family protein n=1 Tax=Streptomyces sp. NPDC057798 TaxID=3346252 RepID=UPI0036CBE8E1